MRDRSSTERSVTRAQHSTITCAGGETSTALFLWFLKWRCENAWSSLLSGDALEDALISHFCLVCWRVPTALGTHYNVYRSAFFECTVGRGSALIFVNVVLFTRCCAVRKPLNGGAPAPWVKKSTTTGSAGVVHENAAACQTLAAAAAQAAAYTFHAE